MKTVLFYTIPATGHVFSMLPLMERFVKQGDAVTVYCTEKYRDAVEKTGATVRLYDMDDTEINLKDGSRILKFYHLVLKYTAAIIDGLIADGRKLKPRLIICDAAAHWGKRVGEILQIPCVSFCSFIAVSNRISGVSFQYLRYFFKSTVQDARELSMAKTYIKQLKETHRFSHFGITDVLLNQGSFNIISYSKKLQTAPHAFDESYFFLGTSTTLRNYGPWDNILFEKSKVNVYLSLGTIFNDNRLVYDSLLKVLESTDYKVYISANPQLFPPKWRERFTVKSFFNQQEMLEHADLFITAGGVNSVSEAIKSGTPSLMLPQQGEQRILCEQVQALGFGVIGDFKKELLPQLNRALALKKTWNVSLSQEISTVRMEELMKHLNSMGGEE